MSDGSDPTTHEGTGTDRPDRRRALKIGAAVTGAAWVAPAILSLDAAAAQTGPGPGFGFIGGTTFGCQGPLGNAPITLSPTGGLPGPFQSDPNGLYLLGPLPVGQYTVSITGSPTQNVAVTTGATTTADLGTIC